jgi:hypothetical protein
MAPGTSIDNLQRWYRSQCDGDWEHGEGIKIETLDNPGWSVSVSLLGTDLERANFDRVELQRSDEDWVHAWVEDDRWQAACGAMNLDEALQLFASWAGSS